MTATILAIETSTHACSVALQKGQDVLHRRELAARKHGELLLPWVQGLLAEAELEVAALDAIAVSRGPGAFTGVRMGIAVAQGLAMAHHKPTIAISSLAACAHGAWRQTGANKHLVAFDARMGELYWGQVLVAEAGQARLLHESVLRPEDVELPPDEDGSWLAVSDGWAAYPEFQQRAQACLLADNSMQSWLPDAEDVLALAQTEYAAGRVLEPENLQPKYLRDNVAQKPKKSPLIV
jgi:tRNA threonylcarbamoyladenosine biosynthesis protein TsaB